jgi:hypothetical protein
MLQKIFSGAAIGAAATAGISYLAAPVYVPAELLWSASTGMLSGALGGTFIGCMTNGMKARSNDARSAYSMGAAFSMVSCLFSGMAAMVDTISSIDPDIDDQLKKQIIGIYGEDFTGAREGDTVRFDAIIFGDQKEPATAIIRAQPTGKIRTGGSALQFEVCAKFDVTLKNAPTGESEEHVICNTRDLTPKEIRRIVPTFN